MIVAGNTLIANVRLCLMNIAKRIREKRKVLGLTQAQVADYFGISSVSVSEWERGMGRPGQDKLPGLARLLKTTVNYLLTGADDGDQQSQFEVNVVPAVTGARAIPVISAIQAGALKEIADPYSPGAGTDIIYTDNDLSKWAFALEINGDSMLPEFRQGDRVIIDPELSPNPGDFVVAKNGEQEATFKKYRPRGVDSAGNDIFELAPLNDDYPTLRSDVQHLLIIGVMVEHRKKYRRK